MVEYVADFETQKDPQTGDMSVWAWALAPVDNPDKIEYGNNIIDFINRLKDFRSGIKVGFHNLKFDGSYIINSLFNDFHYEWVKSRKELKSKTFTTLISAQGVHYSYTICFYDNKRIKIFDTLKIFQKSVAEIALEFKLPMLKGEIDYKKFRGYNYQMTDEEKTYIKNDVQIICLALQAFRKEGMTRDTIASCALNFYKKEYFYNNYRFLNKFPVIDKGDYKLMRNAYRGGYVYANPKYQNKVVNHGIVLDVNSLYPYVMSSEDILLPIGTPKKFKGKYKKSNLYPLYIQFFAANFKLKKNKIPTIQVKGGAYMFNPTEYVTSSKGNMINLALSNVDLETFFECYNVIEIEYMGGYMFTAVPGLFKEYVEHFAKMKIEATKEGNAGKRATAKRLLNSLYGKFGATDNPYIKQPYIGEDKKLKFQTVEAEEPPKTIYLPVAIFITANARKIIQRAYIDNLERCIYCDTDSLHLLGDKIPNNIKVDKTEFGAFDKELVFEHAKVIGAKSYIEQYKVFKPKLKITKITKTKIKKHIERFYISRKLYILKFKVTCAGMPHTEDNLSLVNFKTFRVGSDIFSKLKFSQGVGGAELIDSEFTIHERKKRTTK